jgi:SET family sugar efflux transporter-like MFS transporter
MLSLNSASLLGLSAASFPLLFAIARGYLNGTDDRVIASGMAALRMGASLSWTAGPALAAAVVTLWDLEAVYLAAATLAILALALFVLAGHRVMPVASPSRQRVTRHVWISAAPILVALTAYHASMFAGSNAMSILVAQEFGSSFDVGLLFSLCALLEVAAMSIFVIRPVSDVSRSLLLAGFAIFAAYFALPIVWPTLSAFYVGQLLRAVGIAIVSIVGMAYLQDLLPGRTGIAAALFGNTSSAGLLLSGIATGLWAGQFGYLSLFAACGVLCLAGSVPLCLCRQLASKTLP